MFREKCATCHQAHGLGHAVGPDLSAEFQRAEETIIRDVLAPSDAISPGYVTYAVATEAGQVSSGLLGVLLVFARRFRQAGGHLKLCEIAPGLREVFRIAGYEGLFEIYPDEMRALDAF